MNISNSIIIIQKNIKKFLVRKNILIPSSMYQSKTWRQNQNWYINGKSNECEKYQITNIENIIKSKITKTNDRINFEKNIISSIKNPHSYPDGYEWCENFDGKIKNNNNLYYFNLKFICGNGGGQTRSLKEVYHFINAQLEYLLISNIDNIKIFNILDGNESYKNKNKFIYLLNKDKYINVKQYIFVGDLYEFQKYINKNKLDIV